MKNDQVIATYWLETAFSLEKACEIIVSEQSTGTFLPLPNETDSLKQKHRAQILSIQELESSPFPSLPGAKVPAGSKGEFRRGIVKIAFPYANIGPSIPNLLATVAGNLYELEELSGLRLLDLDLPLAFQERYEGPQFGISGTRELTGVHGRPIIGTIMKPNIGLPTEQLRLIVRELALSGIDFIKDDEVHGNPPYAPIAERIKVVMEEIERAADRTGKKTMYAFNITDDIDPMKRHLETVVKAGGNCVMVSINSIGFAGLAHLRKNTSVCIHGHRNQWGMMSRYPYLGMSFAAYQKLCRLAGVDHLHVNGLNNKFYEDNASVVDSVRACMTPMFDPSDTVLPVLSSKQWAGAAPETYSTLGTVDLMNIAGGGIHGHPGGPGAGFRSLVQGWEAALEGIPLHLHADKHPELKQALAAFG
ncbi:RuBisCO large subunit C-terminal-like domain-containing protein [Paenibacillus chondroitinus]|uniref:RuBisCO large subunit C-terminal-like domain-containing protein n=1 Tax=Paenibacillus chondroitinus TaxID=59842 RepID=A0ABU6D9G7_9BACL|nr:RuBisCO large subunit C-terminal-like domain-containing protein [Paenibacillus anseongense]MCY9656735.1 RuBisCO large subunit C-terminal-like domain-containing protein [Paenibacillus anseongense]MEB4794384.1 RuBisCO large subunit C-terminal-like domain-containing protein [Paenibacillus chondroitinus]